MLAYTHQLCVCGLSSVAWHNWDASVPITNMGYILHVNTTTTTALCLACLVAVPANAHEEVVWLDVAVNEILVVDVLYATNHLCGETREKK